MRFPLGFKPRLGQTHPYPHSPPLAASQPQTEDPRLQSNGVLAPADIPGLAPGLIASPSRGLPPGRVPSPGRTFHGARVPPWKRGGSPVRRSSSGTSTAADSRAISSTSSFRSATGDLDSVAVSATASCDNNSQGFHDCASQALSRVGSVTSDAGTTACQETPNSLSNPNPNPAPSPPIPRPDSSSLLGEDYQSALPVATSRSPSLGPKSANPSVNSPPSKAAEPVTVADECTSLEEEKEEEKGKESRGRGGEPTAPSAREGAAGVLAAALETVEAAAAALAALKVAPVGSEREASKGEGQVAGAAPVPTPAAADLGPQSRAVPRAVSKEHSQGYTPQNPQPWPMHPAPLPSQVSLPSSIKLNPQPLSQRLLPQLQPQSQSQATQVQGKALPSAQRRFSGLVGGGDIVKGKAQGTAPTLCPSSAAQSRVMPEAHLQTSSPGSSGGTPRHKAVSPYADYKAPPTTALSATAPPASPGSGAAAAGPPLAPDATPRPDSLTPTPAPLDLETPGSVNSSFPAPTPDVPSAEALAPATAPAALGTPAAKAGQAAPAEAEQEDQDPPSSDDLPSAEALAPATAPAALGTPAAKAGPAPADAEQGDHDPPSGDDLFDIQLHSQELVGVRSQALADGAAPGARDSAADASREPDAPAGTGTPAGSGAPAESVALAEAARAALPQRPVTADVVRTRGRPLLLFWRKSSGGAPPAPPAGPKGSGEGPRASGASIWRKSAAVKPSPSAECGSTEAGLLSPQRKEHAAAGVPPVPAPAAGVPPVPAPVAGVLPLPAPVAEVPAVPAPVAGVPPVPAPVSEARPLLSEALSGQAEGAAQGEHGQEQDHRQAHADQQEAEAHNGVQRPEEEGAGTQQQQAHKGGEQWGRELECQQQEQGQEQRQGQGHEVVPEASRELGEKQVGKAGEREVGLGRNELALLPLRIQSSARVRRTKGERQVLGRTEVTLRFSLSLPNPRRLLSFSFSKWGPLEIPMPRTAPPSAAATPTLPSAYASPTLYSDYARLCIQGASLSGSPLGALALDMSPSGAYKLLSPPPDSPLSPALPFLLGPLSPLAEGEEGEALSVCSLQEEEGEDRQGLGLCPALGQVHSAHEEGDRTGDGQDRVDKTEDRTEGGVPMDPLGAPEGAASGREALGVPGVTEAEGDRVPPAATGLAGQSPESQSLALVLWQRPQESYGTVTQLSEAAQQEGGDQVRAELWRRALARSRREEGARVWGSQGAQSEEHSAQYYSTETDTETEAETGESGGESQDEEGVLGARGGRRRGAPGRRESRREKRERRRLQRQSNKTVTSAFPTGSLLFVSKMYHLAAVAAEVTNSPQQANSHSEANSHSHHDANSSSASHCPDPSTFLPPTNPTDGAASSSPPSTFPKSSSSSKFSDASPGRAFLRQDSSGLSSSGYSSGPHSGTSTPLEGLGPGAYHAGTVSRVVFTRHTLEAMTGNEDKYKDGVTVAEGVTVSESVTVSSEGVGVQGGPRGHLEKGDTHRTPVGHGHTQGRVWLWRREVRAGAQGQGTGIRSILSVTFLWNSDRGAKVPNHPNPHSASAPAAPSADKLAGNAVQSGVEEQGPQAVLTMSNEESPDHAKKAHKAGGPTWIQFPIVRRKSKTASTVSDPEAEESFGWVPIHPAGPNDQVNKTHYRVDQVNGAPYGADPAVDGASRAGPLASFTGDLNARGDWEDAVSSGGVLATSEHTARGVSSAHFQITGGGDGGSSVVSVSAPFQITAGQLQELTQASRLSGLSRGSSSASARGSRRGGLPWIMCYGMPEVQQGYDDEDEVGGRQGGESEGGERGWEGRVVSAGGAQGMILTPPTRGAPPSPGLLALTPSGMPLSPLHMLPSPCAASTPPLLDQANVDQLLGSEEDALIVDLAMLRTSSHRPVKDIMGFEGLGWPLGLVRELSGIPESETVSFDV